MASEYLSERTKGINPSKIREVFTKVQELKKRGIGVVDFSVGRPDFDTPQHIKKATKKALDEGLVHYTSSAGIIELREAVCYRFEKDYKLNINPEEVIITAGASEAGYIALQSILNQGDEVLVPEPMYVYYSGWSFLGGAKCVTFPLRSEDNFLLNAEEMKKHITPQTKVLILTSPHNPTGQVFDKDNIKKIAKLAIKYNLIVISDDIYNKMLYDNVEHFSIAKLDGMKERTIIIGSFSKTYAMDGWRVGYLVAPLEIISGTIKMHQHVLSCPNTFVQVGARVALISSQDCVKEMVTEFDRRRRLLMSYLDEMSISYVRPRGAFYIFPSIKKFCLRSKEFSDYLLEEARVAVVPGDAFGKAGEGYIRIAYTTPYEEIEKGMERVKMALKRIERSSKIKNFE